MLPTWPRFFSPGVFLFSIGFTAVETNQNRKLSHPWHGPYRILHRDDPDITAAKVYFPDDGQIQVHQQRVTKCPLELIVGYYRYGPKNVVLARFPTGSLPYTWPHLTMLNPQLWQALLIVDQLSLTPMKRLQLIIVLILQL